jgi:hypothetical protein
MFVRYAVFAMVMTLPWIVSSLGYAKTTTLSRREIRQMPVLERPSRLGHFYGNTVRRNYVRKSQTQGPIVENGVPTPVVENGVLSEP